MSLSRDGALRIAYLLEADLEQVLLPPLRSAPARAEQLWRHTCFEAFLAREGTEGYLELNFSPSGDWAVYRFAAYREAMAAAELVQAPQVSVGRGERTFEIQVLVPRLPSFEVSGSTGFAAAKSGASAGSLRVALCAVVEQLGGGLSYWALHHPAGRPDFHHPEGFSIALECHEVD